MVIRALQEETGTTIEIGDDGTITIACVSSEGGEAARKRKIQEITAEVEVGKVYDGTVLRLLDFGAIVSLLPGKDGLLHISQISHERVNSVADHLKEGQQVKVKVLEADEKGRVRLSMKAVTEQPARRPRRRRSLATLPRSEKGRRGALSHRLCVDGSNDPESATGPYSPPQVCSAVRSCLLADLPLPHLVERLAVDAQRRGRPRFEALQSDLDAAAVAVAVFVGVDRMIVSSIFLISLRSRSRLRSSSAMSDSWLARSFGSANTVASSCIVWTVRSMSSDSSSRSAPSTC